MLKGLYIMDKELAKRVYTEENRKEISKYVDIVGPDLSKEDVTKKKIKNI